MRERETERQRERETERETERAREREKEREIDMNVVNHYQRFRMIRSLSQEPVYTNI